MITGEQVKAIVEYLRPDKSFFYSTLDQVLGLLNRVSKANQEAVRTTIIETVRENLSELEPNDTFIGCELEKDACDILTKSFQEVVIEEVSFAVDAVFRCTSKEG